MKQVLAFLFLIASNPSFAEQFSNTSMMDLASERAGVGVTIGHPGDPVSGVCFIEIVADSRGRGIPISNLLAVLDVTDQGSPHHARPVDVISDKTLRISLIQGLFMDGVNITSRDGSSLRETIRRTLGDNRTVVILPRSC